MVKSEIKEISVNLELKKKVLKLCFEYMTIERRNNYFLLKLVKVNIENVIITPLFPSSIIAIRGC